MGAFENYDMKKMIRDAHNMWFNEYKNAQMGDIENFASVSDLWVLQFDNFSNYIY